MIALVIIIIAIIVLIALIKSQKRGDVSQEKPGENAMREIQRAARTSIPRAVSGMDAEHFQENFRRGGFVNNGLQKWNNVKRRKYSYHYFCDAYQQRSLC